MKPDFIDVESTKKMPISEFMYSEDEGLIGICPKCENFVFCTDGECTTGVNWQEASCGCGHEFMMHGIVPKTPYHTRALIGAVIDHSEFVEDFINQGLHVTKNSKDFATCLRRLYLVSIYFHSEQVFLLLHEILDPSEGVQTGEWPFPEDEMMDGDWDPPFIDFINPYALELAVMRNYIVAIRKIIGMVDVKFVNPSNIYPGLKVAIEVNLPRTLALLLPKVGCQEDVNECIVLATEYKFIEIRDMLSMHLSLLKANNIDVKRDISQESTEYFKSS